LISEAMPQSRSVSIGVWVVGGSRFEARGQDGIAHFIEHLLFKGTTSRSAGDIAHAIDAAGGQLDAFTDKEYVCVYARVLDRHLRVAFEILADIALHPVFPPAEIRRERNVIFEEINSIEDSPQDLVHEIFMQNIWPDHPLGRPVSGTKQSVGSISRADLLRFFERHYSARNMVLTVAGNLGHAEVRQLARRFFDRAEAGEPVNSGGPPQLRTSRVLREKPNLEQVHICLGTGCPPLLSKDRFKVHLLSTILGGGISSRLFQNIREKRGLVYSIESNVNLYRDAGSIVVSAAAVPGAAARVVELICRELRAMRRENVPARELRRAKDFVEGSFLLGMESTSSRMMHLAQQEIYFRRLFSIRETLESIESVRPGDIRRLADEILESSEITLTALGSDGLHGLKSIPLKV